MSKWFESIGFRVENGTPRDRPLSPRAMVLDFPPEPYKKTYVQQSTREWRFYFLLIYFPPFLEHWNFVGYLNVVGEEKKEPAAISILMRNNEELGFTTCAALIRTQLVRVVIWLVSIIDFFFSLFRFRELLNFPCGLLQATRLHRSSSLR